MSCVKVHLIMILLHQIISTLGKKFLKENESTYRITVVAKPLSDILDFYHVDNIDFMSLDVEGFEVEVLRGINFESGHAPEYSFIEVRPELEREN